MRISSALFGLAAACFFVFLIIEASHLDGTSPLDKGLARPAVSVWHERASPEHSRCDECPQPGDVLRAHVDGSSDAVHGIAVYRDDQHVHSCVGCDDLATVVDRIGRYTVVGFQMDRRGSCVLLCNGLDPDVAGLKRCGAEVDMKNVDIR